MDRRRAQQFFWLMVTAALVWLMVIVGGATRLTQSGLSIVEWRPITGIVPPLSDAAWQVEFQKYQQTPEAQQVNATMGLQEFKFIYRMEYGHRLLGRLMGLWFLGGMIFFWATGSLNRKIKSRSVMILTLGLAQGFLGWYMVKSGLVKDPHVSHYRLAAHLLLAIVLLGVLLWTALGLRWHRRGAAHWMPAAFVASVMVTVTFGAFVAGLKAGLIYNTFPLMNGAWIAEDWLFLTPRWLNLLENPATVQFIHRWLGTATGVLGLWVAWRFWGLWPSRWLALLVGGQVCLGIVTLLAQVPVSLGVLHQGVGSLVFAMGLVLMYLTRRESLKI